MKLTEMIEFARKDGAWWLGDFDVLDGIDQDKVKEVLSSLKDPKWDETGKIHDWRNYVGCWRECWDKLNIETRFALFHIARTQADQEQWD